MKIKSLYIVFILTLLACSKDDDNTRTIVVEEVKVIETFNPISITFVYEDGSSIQSDDCISPDLNYAIQIETTKNNEGNKNVSQIEYTINGALYSMSFSQAGIKRNPIVLVNGKNIAELVYTAVSVELNYTAQDDFELVD